MWWIIGILSAILLYSLWRESIQEYTAEHGGKPVGCFMTILVVGIAEGIFWLLGWLLL